jgi:hypothetical protein
MSQRHPFVRLTSTSLRPDLPGGRAPSASVVPDAAPRHRVSRRAASLTMRARCYDLRWSARIHQKTSGSRACKPNSRCLTAGRKSNASPNIRRAALASSLPAAAYRMPVTVRSARTIVTAFGIEVSANHGQPAKNHTSACLQRQAESKVNAVGVI